MTRSFFILTIGIALILAACTPGTSATSIITSPTVIASELATIQPVTKTPPAQNYTPSPTSAIPSEPGISELKYRILAEFPDIFYCDPDYYPVARNNELELAVQRFPELQANTEEFKAILAHNNLLGASTFSDDEKLLIYREHKKLMAIQLVPVDDSYQFQILVAKTEGKGELITGLIDHQGSITVQQRTDTVATCPICLIAGTLIDTPTGSISVQSLRPGTLVWTMDKAGKRVAQPLIKIKRTFVPANHQIVHLVLDDGRELWVSPGHPTTDGVPVGELQTGDRLSGGVVLTIERVGYSGSATYDLLPDGETGWYWAKGILLASTLNR